MQLAFFVNDVMTEEVGYSTNRLALAALARGHEAWVIQADGFKYDKDDSIKAKARHVRKAKYASSEAYLKDLQNPKAAKLEEISVNELDILFLRSDPSLELGPRSWAQAVGINFGREAVRHGVIVLNDPSGLAKALNKMYFQLFPEEVRPRTIITRDKEAIKQFAKEEGGNIVLKPMQGSRGERVFFVTKEEMANLNQIVDALTKDGYIIAQEYLPAAKKGNTRVLLLNGEPLKYKGKYAAYKRIGDGQRGHYSKDSFQKTELNDSMMQLADMVRPRLVQDGMFFVGLDIVGDKLMDIKVFSPGGLGNAQKLEGVNFSLAVIEALERKVDYMQYYRRKFDNVEMATL
jgi:glutathione synthase